MAFIEIKTRPYLLKFQTLVFARVYLVVFFFFDFKGKTFKIKVDQLGMYLLGKPVPWNILSLCLRFHLLPFPISILTAMLVL